MLTRLELLNRLKLAGLEVAVRPVKRTPKSLEKAFPSKPKDHFVMSVDNESFWVSRFNTIGQAKQLAEDFDDGFRFSNWYFAGQITVETSNRIVTALDASVQE